MGLGAWSLGNLRCVHHLSRDENGAHVHPRGESRAESQSPPLSVGVAGSALSSWKTCGRGQWSPPGPVSQSTGPCEDGAGVPLARHHFLVRKGGHLPALPKGSQREGVLLCGELSVQRRSTWRSKASSGLLLQEHGSFPEGEGPYHVQEPMGLVVTVDTEPRAQTPVPTTYPTPCSTKAGC